MSHRLLSAALRAEYAREGYEFVDIAPTSTLLPAGWNQGNVTERQMNIVNHLISQASQDDSIIDRLAAHAGKVIIMESHFDARALSLIADAAAKGRDEDKARHEIIKGMIDAAKPVYDDYTRMMRQREIRKEMDEARARERAMEQYM